MAGSVRQAELVIRSEALRFGIQVLDRNDPVGEDDQELIYPAGLADADDFPTFVHALVQRFRNRPDGAGCRFTSTLSRFMDLVESYRRDDIPRSRLYTRVCILFIGHPGLLNGFERLRLMNDGREETRLQIRQWRNRVRFSVLPAIFEVLTNCVEAIERLKRMPETLEIRNRNFIAATCCFPAGLDPHNVMANLVTNPTSVSDLVLPGLRAKWRLYRQLWDFVALYFGTVDSSNMSD